jgi:hypothetical protein
MTVSLLLHDKILSAPLRYSSTLLLICALILLTFPRHESYAVVLVIIHFNYETGIDAKSCHAGLFT